MAQTEQNRKMTYGTQNKQYQSYKDTPFCEIGNNFYKEFNHCVAIWDKWPVCAGHLLFVPKLNKELHLTMAFKFAIAEGKDQVNKGVIDGYHVGINMHRAGGQSVEWPHVHFIPRLLHDNGETEPGSVRLARAGGRLATSYTNHPRYQET